MDRERTPAGVVFRDRFAKRCFAYVCDIDGLRGLAGTVSMLRKMCFMCSLTDRRVKKKMLHMFMNIERSIVLAQALIYRSLWLAT